jgi:hypothetical protein
VSIFLLVLWHGVQSVSAVYNSWDLYRFSNEYSLLPWCKRGKKSRREVFFGHANGSFRAIIRTHPWQSPGIQTADYGSPPVTGWTGAVRHQDDCATLLFCPSDINRIFNHGKIFPW